MRKNVLVLLVFLSAKTSAQNIRQGSSPIKTIGSSGNSLYIEAPVKSNWHTRYDTSYQLVYKDFNLNLWISRKEFSNKKFLDSIRTCCEAFNALAIGAQYNRINVNIHCGLFKRKKYQYIPAVLFKNNPATSLIEATAPTEDAKPAGL